MEILSETTFWSAHILLLILIGGITFFTFIGTINLIFETIKDFNISVLIGSICFGLMLAVSLYLTIVGISEGPVVEYTAKVTDYNEVYEQGYEVERHEGKLVILTKGSR